MRVQLLIRDTEYKNALTDMIAAADMDIFVDAGKDTSKDGRSVILTDISPGEIEEDILARIRGRTLFLTGKDLASKRDDVYTIFKHTCVSNILAKLAFVHHEWTGDTGNISSSSRTIAVIGESDTLSSDRCQMLARQIIYRRGGSVLILPLSFINDYPVTAGDGRGWFARLMYLIDEGRDYPAECYTTTDSYGITYLMLPQGLNPVAGLDGEYLSKLIRNIGCRFDTLILDIGTCYRRENIEVASHADDLLFIGTGRRIENPEKIIGSSMTARLRTIWTTPGTDVTLQIDDCVRDIYRLDVKNEKRDST